MSETVSVRIPKDKYLLLKALAKQRGVMISWLLDRVLGQYIAINAKQKGDSNERAS